MRSILDGGIISLSLLFVCWAFVLGPVYQSSGSGLVAQVIGLAYPLGDILTASVVIIIASRAAGPERFRFLLLMAGFLANAVADSAFAYLTGAGLYTVRGSVLDAAWVAGFLLIALAALWPAEAAAGAEEATLRPWQVTLPGMAFAAAILSTLALAAMGHPPAANMAVLLAALGLLLIISHDLPDVVDQGAEAQVRQLAVAETEADAGAHRNRCDPLLVGASPGVAGLDPLREGEDHNLSLVQAVEYGLQGEERATTRDQFPACHGLGEVVVGADVIAEGARVHVVEDRNQHYRDEAGDGIGLETAADLEAVGRSGHHDVEQDQVAVLSEASTKPAWEPLATGTIVRPTMPWTRPRPAFSWSCRPPRAVL